MLLSTRIFDVVSIVTNFDVVIEVVVTVVVTVADFNEGHYCCCSYKSFCCCC